MSDRTTHSLGSCIQSQIEYIIPEFPIPYHFHIFADSVLMSLLSLPSTSVLLRLPDLEV